MAVWEPHTHKGKERRGAFPLLIGPQLGPEQQPETACLKSLNGQPMGGGRGVDQALRPRAFVSGMVYVAETFGNIGTNLTYPQDCWTLEQSH